MMTLVTELFLILTQNLVFSHLIGFPALRHTYGRRKHLMLSAIMSALFILVSCTVLSAFRGIFPQGNAKLLLPLCCALLNGLLDVCLVLPAGLLLKKRSGRVIALIHEAACSGAVLGAVLLCFANAAAVPAAFAFGLRCAIGYLVAYAMLAAAAPVLYSEKMPAAVRGWRGMYLYAGLIGLAVACINL